MGLSQAVSFPTRLNNTLDILATNRPDLVDIKIQTGLARDTSNTFLTIEESSVQGMDNTDIVGIVSGSALDVGTGFTPDSTLVKITKFELDLNGAVVKLEFNDVIQKPNKSKNP